MDASGAGPKHRSPQAGKGDVGLFCDADGSGTISDDREYIFTERDKTAGDDLAALRSRFDANRDGRLSGAELAGFKVLVTQADGARTIQTAAALGVTEIGPTPDTTRIQLADGSAITGQARLVQGGVTKVPANATLATPAAGHRVAAAVSVTARLRTVTQTGYDAGGCVVFGRPLKKVFWGVAAGTVLRKVVDNGAKTRVSGRSWQVFFNSERGARVTSACFSGLLGIPSRMMPITPGDPHS